MGKVAEIFAELGFKFEKTTLGDFIKSIKELDMSVIASAAGVGGLYLAMKILRMKPWILRRNFIISRWRRVSRRKRSRDGCGCRKLRGSRKLLSLGL